MNIPIQIWLTIGFIAYYLILQLYSDFVRFSTKTNLKSRIIESFRSKYKVNIRTFHSSKPLYGFAWFRSIWINDNILKFEKHLKFTLHHEYYHLKNHHKQWTLALRFVISITPLSLYFVPWWVFLIIILVTAYIVDIISNVFESKANDYASEITKE